MDTATAATSSPALFNGAMLALLGAALTFAATQFTEARRRKHEAARLERERAETKRLRREALLIVFYGEVSTLDNFLWMEAERGLTCVRRGFPIEVRPFRIPRDIFDANASSLGDLGDSHLVEGLVTLYAIAEYVQAQARELASREPKTDVASLRYLQDLASHLGSVVHTHAWLREQTKSLRAVPSRIDRQTFDAEHGEHLVTAERLTAAVEEVLVVKP